MIAQVRRANGQLLRCEIRLHASPPGAHIGQWAFSFSVPAGSEDYKLNEELHLALDDGRTGSGFVTSVSYSSNTSYAHIEVTGNGPLA